jgi:hypothetical protein
MVAGFCMMAAPLLLLVATVIQPEHRDGEGAQLQVIAADADEWFAAQTLGLVAIALAVPLVLGLMHMLRSREVAYGHVGGGLALIGLVAFAGLTGIGMALREMAQSADPGAMALLLEDVREDTAMMFALYLPAVIGFTLGFVALAVGLYRARAVQSWMAVCVGVGTLLVGIEQVAFTDWLGIVGAAVSFVGLASIGRMVMKESDSDWEHTPEYKGFRPLAGMR